MADGVISVPETMPRREIRRPIPTVWNSNEDNDAERGMTGASTGQTNDPGRAGFRGSGPKTARHHPARTCRAVPHPWFRAAIGMVRGRDQEVAAESAAVDGGSRRHSTQTTAEYQGSGVIRVTVGIRRDASPPPKMRCAHPVPMVWKSNRHHPRNQTGGSGRMHPEPGSSPGSLAEPRPTPAGPDRSPDGSGQHQPTPADSSRTRPDLAIPPDR